MVFSYLFEAKSIQAYLFASGKLKDTISASERLGMLIDSTSDSTLYNVIEMAGLESDLLDNSMSDKASLIRFLRCKGGSFYAYCKEEQPLVELRSLWTLTVQQMFPSLEFTDALSQASSLQESISLGHKTLSSNRNTPSIKFPISTAITRRNIKTGNSEVPMSSLCKRVSSKKDDSVDIDNELHRQVYQALDMRSNAALQDRFTPVPLKGKVAYPIDLENDFKYVYSGEQIGDKEGKQDIALIHIDGNGLGIVLLALKAALEAQSDDEYRKGFRDFSDALSVATELAAQEATQWVYDVARYDVKEDTRKFLPIRPIVLGGDDVTLLCQSALAVEYSERFCKAFEHYSREALSSLFNGCLKESGLSDYLTASGGILFNKGKHPFMHSHHIVEALCDQAKVLTKSINSEDTKKVGPAALAFYRLSNASNRALSDLQKDMQHVQALKNIEINLAQNAFFVEMSDSSKADLTTLKTLVLKLRDKKASFNVAKLRQMVTCLGVGDKEEAGLIYSRAIDRAKDKQFKAEVISLFKQFAELNGVAETNDFYDWYWKTSDGGYQSIIYDVLHFDHFYEPKVAPIPPENNDKEVA